MTDTLNSASVSVDRWPDVAATPPSRIRAGIARALVMRTARRMPLRVALPDGSVIGDLGPTMRLRRPDDFFRRLGVGGLIGFGEAYQAGDWETDDLPGLLEVLAGHVETIVPPALQWPRRFHAASFPTDTVNTLRNSSKNIEHHYDLSNDLFAEFLDETMTLLVGPLRGRQRPTELGRPCRRPAAQDRSAARPRPASGRQPGAGNRHRLGRAGDPGRRARRDRTFGHACRSSRRRSPRRGSADAGLDSTGSMSELLRLSRNPRSKRLRRGRQRRDDRGGRRGILADVLLHAAAAGGTGRPHRHAGDHHGRITGCCATRRTLHLDPEIHLSRRSDSLSGGDRDRVPAMPLVDRLRVRCRLRADAADVARTIPKPVSTRIAGYGFDDVFRRTWELYLAYSEAGFAAGYLNVG